MVHGRHCLRWASCCWSCFPGLKQGIHLVFPKTPLPSQQGEKILKLAEICRKFETEEEKVLPFYSSVLTPMELEEVERQNEDLTEELAKVKDGEGGGWAAFAQGNHHTPLSSASTLRLWRTTQGWRTSGKDTIR